MGPIGAIGPSGPKGDKGDAGGPSGPQGATGSQGAVGATGAQGLIGAAGAAGPIGPQGPAGTNGTNGATGATGAVGPTGATGPAGGLAEYAYVYNVDAGVVALEAPINFSSNGVMTAGITHALASAGIALSNAGDYKVTFSVSGVEPSQIALFVNGAAVAGGVYGSGAGTQQTTGQMIITAAAGDVLTVVNHSSAAAVTLQTLAGGTQTNANASVTIEKLA